MKAKHFRIIIIILFILLAVVAGIAVPDFFRREVVDEHSFREAIKEVAKEEADEKANGSAEWKLKAQDKNESDVSLSGILEREKTESENTYRPLEDDIKAAPISASNGNSETDAQLEPANATEPVSKAQEPEADAQNSGGQEVKQGQVDKPIGDNTGKDTAETDKTVKAETEKDEKAEDSPQTDIYNQEWIELKISENRHLIKEQDLQDIRSIIGKLDIEYIKGLMQESNSEKMYENIDKYLGSKLSTEEVDRAKELFIIYSNIIYK